MEFYIVGNLKQRGSCKWWFCMGYTNFDEKIINSINPSQTVHFNLKEPLVNVKVADILVLYQSTSKNFFWQKKKHFQKLKEIFHNNISIYNNFSHCLPRCYILGAAKSYSEGKCLDFKMTVLVIKCKELFTSNEDAFWETERGFSSQHAYP